MQILRSTVLEVLEVLVQVLEYSYLEHAQDECRCSCELAEGAPARAVPDWAAWVPRWPCCAQRLAMFARCSGTRGGAAGVGEGVSGSDQERRAQAGAGEAGWSV